MGVLGPAVARGITAGTFHSICARILRQGTLFLFLQALAVRNMLSHNIRGRAGSVIFDHQSLLTLVCTHIHQVSPFPSGSQLSFIIHIFSS
jgi:superfamily I DNA/RNA helicase